MAGENADSFCAVALSFVFKDDEMKTDADKKIKPKRPRKVIKKSYMEDSYPTYLQVCMLHILYCCLLTTENFQAIKCCRT